MKAPVVKEYERRLKEVFRSADPELMTRVIRLCVLFEDLRIEYEGAIRRREIPPLDQAGMNYRHLYFIRRSLVTMIEFRGALHRLNELDSWEREVAHMDPSSRKAWNAAITYFNNHHKAWEEVRGDIGGHFKEAAAKFALEKLTKSTGKLIVRSFPDEETGGAVLEFATEFVAIALRKSMTQKRPTVKQRQRFISKTFLRLTGGWKHAVAAVHVVVAEFLFDKFRSAKPVGRTWS